MIHITNYGKYNTKVQRPREEIKRQNNTKIITKTVKMYSGVQIYYNRRLSQTDGKTPHIYVMPASRGIARKKVGGDKLRGLGDGSPQQDPRA